MRMLPSIWRNRLGFAFFSVAGVLSIVSDWQDLHPLTMLASLHNLMLACLYLNRRSETAYDRTGLWLGLLSAFLPIPFIPKNLSLAMLVSGLAGYLLIFWSLISLGESFGVAPADRGLKTSGPYRFIRHPMYLGELVLRGSFLLSNDLLQGSLTLVLLLAIQVLRMRREEKLIADYPRYARLVPWRLIPFFY